MHHPSPHPHHQPQEPQGLIPEDDEEAPEGSTEMDGVIFEGDFEDDSVKPSLTSLLEDVGDDVGGDAFKLDSDDSFFSIPDYVPSELPDLAALGSGACVFLVVLLVWGWVGRGVRVWAKRARGRQGCVPPFFFFFFFFFLCVCVCVNCFY